MSDTNSEAFVDAAGSISLALYERLNVIPGYIGSLVLEITKDATRKDTVIASGQIFFDTSSQVTLNNVTSVMETASNCTDCLLQGSSFTETSLCEHQACDDKTTTCTSSDGTFTCKCQDGYIKTTYSNRMCIACPTGTHATASGCEDCPFGHSGFNCEDKWKLLLVIIGSVLGGLLLICLILLPVVALTSPKKSSKKNKDADTGKPHITHSSAKSPVVNSNVANNQAASLNVPANGFTNAGVPQVPWATTNSAWDSRTNLEMISSHSQQNLIPEGWNSRPFNHQDEISPYGLSRQNSQYSQRPQSNPYSQTRPQFNPYAQNQGHRNPYYM